jgi:hypothetical protein
VGLSHTQKDLLEMTLQLEQTWEGNGQAWKRLIIRNFSGGVQGIMMDAGGYIKDETIDLSHHKTLDEAINDITNRDLAMYNDVIVDGEEG